MTQQLARKYVALHEAGRQRALERAAIQQPFADEHAVEKDLAQPVEIALNDLVVEIAGPVLPEAVQDRLRDVAAERASRKAAILAACKEHVGRDSQRQLDHRLRVDRRDDLRPGCARLRLAGVEIRVPSSIPSLLIASHGACRNPASHG